ncbi:MAG: hypothetical protein ACK5LC_08995 [Coprobacillaceae bacterium]
MKQTKFITMLLLATLALTFYSCSNDDDDDFDNGINGKKITKIVNEYGKDDVRTETFSYSNGKMTKYVAYYDGDYAYTENNQTISYSGNTVVIDGLLDGNKCTQTYTLNSNGLAISCKIVYDKDEDMDDYNYTFQYSDGYLSGISLKYDNYKETQVFTYSNGNISKLAYQESGNNIYNEDYTFTYSNNENTGGIMNPFLWDMLFSHVPAYYMGIFGKSTKNLAVSCIKKHTYQTTYTEETSCVYSLDNDKYVKIATFSDGDKFTYTFE